MNRMRTGFERVYSDDQREAFAIAYVDGGMTAKEVMAAAQAGLLKLNGQKLEPFTINSPDTIRYYAKLLRKRRMGNVKTSLPDSNRDAIVNLKRRLIVLADQEIGVLERQPRGKLDWKVFNDACKALQNAEAIPEPNDPSKPAPGQRDPSKGGKMNGGKTRSGQAGALMKAMTASGPFPRESEQEAGRETAAV